MKHPYTRRVPQVEKVIAVINGNRAALEELQERFAFELAPLEGGEGGRILGVAIVPAAFVQELRRFTIDEQTGALVPPADGVTCPLLRASPRGTGSLWHRCDPNACDPGGCPLGLPRTFDGSSRCSLGNRAHAIAAFLECEIFGFDPTAENSSPMTTWHASLPLGLHTAEFCIAHAGDFACVDHLLLVVEGVRLLDFHFHGADLNLVSGKVEKYDETVLAAVEREIGEETGIKSDAAFLKPIGDPFPRITYRRGADGVERGRPTRRFTQACTYEVGNSAAEEGANVAFRERTDFRGDLFEQEVAERGRLLALSSGSSSSSFA